MADIMDMIEYECDGRVYQIFTPKHKPVVKLSRKQLQDEKLHTQLLAISGIDTVSTISIPSTQSSSGADGKSEDVLALEVSKETAIPFDHKLLPLAVQHASIAYCPVDSTGIKREFLDKNRERKNRTTTTVFRVLKIDAFPMKSNSHSIGELHENWQLRQLDESFPSLQAAKSYIKCQSWNHTELANYAMLNNVLKPGKIASEEEKDAFAEKFCFTDDRYLRHRRYFLSHEVKASELKQKMKRALEAAGISVVS